VGCGCGATPPAGSALFVLAVLLLGRPRRARPAR
jgi:MYXO-CTERM domain-containing protein